MNNSIFVNDAGSPGKKWSGKGAGDRVKSIMWLGILLSITFLSPNHGLGRIYIDINRPSIQRIQIAIPDFKNQSDQKEHPELTTFLPGVISNDLDLSGYFSPMDKAAFLEDLHSSFSPGSIRFKDWSVIGAELLLKGRYTCIGRSLEVEAVLFDVFSGRQILSRRLLGKIKEYRHLMHRLGNEIIYILTRYKGMFLSRLVFVDNSTGHKEIYMCDYDGHNVNRITFDKSIALLPRWSPSGDKIIYNSYRDGGPMLYLKDMATGAERRISARKGLNIGASWAPDGKSVALTLSNGDNPDIYTIDLNGKIIKRLTNHWGIDVSPSFSPDGEKIAFVSNRSGSPQIYTMDIQHEKKERLTFFEGKYNTSPSWSRSNCIAFSGMNKGRFDIYRINADGSNLRKLTKDQGNNEDPCWSPDGRYIVFSSNRDGRYHLYIMNANGHNQRRLTTYKGDQTSPSWSHF
ncbi:MAG: Tol-Pal system beta propeller repeat protein TolB [Thermodesulfobacteriota bacterium]|nr:Tol-Pal system beta propeller repeat protein TolB [Thermodesulfobacteriota bacterium]